MFGRQNNHQSGLALLLFLVVLMIVTGIAGINLLDSKVKAVNQSKIDHDYKVLKKAKQALLNYAVQYSVEGNLSKLGQLPCPDYQWAAPSEGNQDGGCGVLYANNSGYLPWKELGVEVLRDSNGECLWYVVSGDYKRSPSTMVNEDSNGLLNIQDEAGLAYHGANPGDRPIAIIIAPGDAYPGQDRTPDNVNMQHCRGSYVEADYIESGGFIDYAADHVNVADSIWTYVYGSQASRLNEANYNDKMVWLTKNEYWDAVKAQGDLIATVPASAINTLTREITECLAAYANHGDNVDGFGDLRRWLPSPAQVDLIDYRDNDEYTDQAGRWAGRLPGNIDDSQDVTAANIDGGNEDLFAQNTIAECAFTSNQLALWQNWKDHFFYVVSQDFQIAATPSPDLTARCALPGGCITVDGNNMAAVVFYSDSVTNLQSRNSFPDAPPGPEEKSVISNYMEPLNDHDYTGDLDNDYFSNVGDLAYCIRVDTPTTLIAGPC